MLQACQHRGRSSNRSALSVFRRNQCVCSDPLLLMQLELLIDEKDTSVKINTVPGQPQYLALTQAGKQSDERNILIGRSFDYF